MDGSPRCDGKRDLAAIISQLAICTYPAVLQHKVHLELPRVAKLLQYQKQSDLYKNPGQLEKQHHLTQFVVTKTLHIARPHVQPELLQRDDARARAFAFQQVHQLDLRLDHVGDIWPSFHMRNTQNQSDVTPKSTSRSVFPEIIPNHMRSKITF